MRIRNTAFDPWSLIQISNRSFQHSITNLPDKLFHTEKGHKSSENTQSYKACTVKKQYIYSRVGQLYYEVIFFNVTIKTLTRIRDKHSFYHWIPNGPGSSWVSGCVDTARTYKMQGCGSRSGHFCRIRKFFTGSG